MTVSDLRAVQAAIAAGRWRENSQAKDWAGHAVATVLKLDATNKAHKAKIAGLLKTWIANRHVCRRRGLGRASAKSDRSSKSEPQSMADLAAPRSCSFAVPRRTPHPYKGVGAATGAPHLPRLAAPYLIKCGNTQGKNLWETRSRRRKSTTSCLDQPPEEQRRRWRWQLSQQYSSGSPGCSGFLCPQGASLLLHRIA